MKTNAELDATHEDQLHKFAEDLRERLGPIVASENPEHLNTGLIIEVQAFFKILKQFDEPSGFNMISSLPWNSQKNMTLLLGEKLSQKLYPGLKAKKSLSAAVIVNSKNEEFSTPKVEDQLKLSPDQKTSPLNLAPGSAPATPKRPPQMQAATPKSPIALAYQLSQAAALADTKASPAIHITISNLSHN